MFFSDTLKHFLCSIREQRNHRRNTFYVNKITVKYFSPTTHPQSINPLPLETQSVFSFFS